MISPSRASWLVPLLVATVVLIVAIMTVAPWPVGVFEDDAIYTVLAKSLAEGHGYRMINLPGAPHATHYPPGYPLVLAAMWRVFPTFPDNIVVFKFANALFLALAALGTYWFGRLRLGLSLGGAAALALAGTLSIAVLLVTGVVLSEPLFMALAIPALLLAERSVAEGTVRWAVAAGLALGALALVRTLGAVAIPVAALALLVRRRPASAVALVAASAVLLVPWQLWQSAYQHEIPPVLMGKYGAYGTWLADGYRDGGVAFGWKVAAANLGQFKRVLGYLFMPTRFAGAYTAAFIAICALAAGGVAVLVRRAPVTAGFLVAYAAVILIWPFEPDRFILALWPLLMVLGVAAGRAVWQWTPVAGLGRVARTAALAVMVAVSLGHLAYNVRGFRQQWWLSVQRGSGQNAKPIAEWVARHTAMTDVLSTEHDLIVYLYTGRQAVPVSTFLARERVRPLTHDETTAWVETLLDRYRPRYYITGWAPTVRAADTLAARHPPRLRRVAATSNALVYERLDQ